MFNILPDLDAGLNSGIFYSLLYGVYTGIAAITLGNIFMNENQSIGRATVTVLSLLHIFTTINFAFNWAFICSMFINHGQSLGTKYLVVSSPSMTTVVMGVTSAMCTILADSTMIWRCWVAWGRRWRTILLPVVFLVSATVFKGRATYKQYTIPGESHTFDLMLYSSFVLATTLWCTSLTIYRIIVLVRAAGSLRACRHVIVILVESYAIYSIPLAFYMAFYACGNVALNYFDVLAVISRGIAPTLFVGRVAAGYTRLDNCWEESVMSSLHFDGSQSLASTCEDAATTVMLDLEAQGEINDEYGHCVWTSSEGETTSTEGIMHGDVLKAEMERQDDDPNAIVVVSRDL
ncbi:hypothetical protein IW261DRAFT_1607927, partial [Armillaria novae-zelandiae]